MNKLSFRARALDASKPMPIYMSEELPDLPEYSAINRAVPQMPSGMEKEEECEHHLQRAIVTGLIIPTPEVIYMGDMSIYDRLYPPSYKGPRQLIHMQPFTMEHDIPDYDMDSEDELWVDAQMKVLDITPLKFEEMMDRLEKNSGHSVVTQSEAKLLLKEDDDLIIAVYDYWLNKRLKTQTPLIPCVKTEAHRGGNNNNPYLAFRRRTEKMQTRKNRKNDETSYEKMVKLRRDLTRALTLLELVKRREKTKRELFHLTIEVYEKRYQANDFSGQILAEVSAMKHSRPAFAPLFSNQFGAGLHNHSGNWAKPPNEDSTPRKEKRQYKKRKHKASSISPRLLMSGDVVPGLLSSGDDEILLSPHNEELPFVFYRNKFCKYQAPISNGGLGNWPWCSREEGGMAERKFRYSLASIATPKPRCIGFARRRLGRGGRVILDRAGTPMDDYWATMDFTILDSTKEKERLNEELCRDINHYSPAEETPDVFNGNSLTLQVEDLLDPSSDDHLTNVQLNLSELFPSITDTLPIDTSSDFSMDTDYGTSFVKVEDKKETNVELKSIFEPKSCIRQIVCGNSNIYKDLPSTLSLSDRLSSTSFFSNSNFTVNQEKTSTPFNSANSRICSVLNNERRENSSGSLLDRWARFENNPEVEGTVTGNKRSDLSVQQNTRHPASCAGHLQDVW